MPVTAKSCNSGMPTVTYGPQNFLMIVLMMEGICVCTPSKCRRHEPQLHIRLHPLHDRCPSSLTPDQTFHALSKIPHSILSFSLMAWSDESAQSQTYETPNRKDAYLSFILKFSNLCLGADSRMI